MDKPDWKDAPEWATHLIIKRAGPDAGQYEWAFQQGRDYKLHPDGFLCFHPDGYDHVSSRP